MRSQPGSSGFAIALSMQLSSPRGTCVADWLMVHSGMRRVHVPVHKRRWVPARRPLCGARPRGAARGYGGSVTAALRMHQLSARISNPRVPRDTHGFMPCILRTGDSGLWGGGRGASALRECGGSAAGASRALWARTERAEPEASGERSLPSSCGRRTTLTRGQREIMLLWWLRLPQQQQAFSSRARRCHSRQARPLLRVTSHQCLC